MAQQDALQPHQVPQPLVAQKKVEFPTEHPAVALLGAAHQAQRSVVQRTTADELESAPKVSQLVRAAQRALQQPEQRPASQREPSPALSVQRAQQPAQSMQEQPEPQQLEPLAARLAQPAPQLA